MWKVAPVMWSVAPVMWSVAPVMWSVAPVMWSVALVMWEVAPVMWADPFPIEWPKHIKQWSKYKIHLDNMWSGLQIFVRTKFCSQVALPRKRKRA